MSDSSLPQLGVATIVATLRRFQAMRNGLDVYVSDFIPDGAGGYEAIVPTGKPVPNDEKISLFVDRVTYNKLQDRGLA